MKKILALLALGIVLAGCGPKETLHIYTWADYVSPDVIKAFEEKYDCKVFIDTFDTNEAMYAKLKAGAKGYDLLFPSSYMVRLMAMERMIVPLDHEKCPSVRENFDESYTPMLLEDPHLVFAAPYSSSPTILFYDPAKVPSGVEMDTWKVLDNAHFRGKITFLDDMREVIGAGLMANGFSINSTSQGEIDKAVETVLKWKANVRKFDSESYKTEVADGSTWIGQGFGQVARQVIFGEAEDGSDARPDLQYAYPREGFTESCEEMVIPSNAPNPDLAYKFIEFLYSEPEMGVTNMEYVLGMFPCKPAIAALDPKFREAVIAKPEIMEKAQVIVGLEGVPGAMEMYAKAWDRIKATDK